MSKFRIGWLIADVLAIAGGIQLVWPVSPIAGFMMWGAPGITVQMVSGLAVLVVGISGAYYMWKNGK